jgi:hypothetical protein
LALLAASGLKEEAISCRNYGEVSAKFQYQNGVVRVIEEVGIRDTRHFILCATRDLAPLDVGHARGRLSHNQEKVRVPNHIPSSARVLSAGSSLSSPIAS